MPKILVESRNRSPHCRPPLDAIAAACRSLGYRVARWKSPFSRKLLPRHWVPACDLAVLYNGTHAVYSGAVARLRRRGTPVLFVELGWYPQLETFQLDAQGINAAASWVSRPLDVSGITPLPVRHHGDLLLILQHDDDTQITDLSPHFSDMHSFVRHVLAHSTLPVRVRAHPRHKPDDRIASLIMRHGASWDTAPNLEQALADCRALACVNSSSAIEGLARRVPVLCYGEAVFRHPGAVYCLDGDAAETERVTDRLRHGRSDLFEECIGAVLRRIEQHQWRCHELPGRLAPLLEDLLNLKTSPEAGSAAKGSIPFSAGPEAERARRRNVA